MKRILQRLTAAVISICIFLSASPALAATIQTSGDKRVEGLPSRQEVLDLMTLVNDYWQRAKKPQDTYKWEVAAYHHGNMELYFLTGIEKYRQYTYDWAVSNKWSGLPGEELNKNKVLHADNESCFQDYIDLYHLDPSPDKIARAEYAMNYQINTSNKDYFWWVDALYMAMPAFTKMYLLTGNTKYLDKVYSYYDYSKNLLYDDKEGLWYRDTNFVYPKKTSPAGNKIFWSRGMGWNVGAHVKVLQDLPDSHPSKAVYEKMFVTMMKSLITHQHPDGYWTRNIVDEANAPGPETSGTVFFTYGLAWGINTGRLDAETYLPALIKAWDYLQHTAIRSDGRVGYVQPIGYEPAPDVAVDANSTQYYAVGTFLLAAAEVSKLVGDMEGNLEHYLGRRMISKVALKIDSPYGLTGRTIKKIDDTGADVRPFIQNGRTLVPLRFVGEGLKAQVKWLESSQMIFVVKGENRVLMTIGQSDYTLNGEDRRMEVPAQIIDGRTMVPLRDLAEALGQKVYWDDARQIIVLSEQENPFYPNCETGLFNLLDTTLTQGRFSQQ